MKDQASRPGTLRLLRAGLAALTLAAAGCSTPVELQGDYSNGATTLTGGINATTNAIIAGGTYQAGATNLGGSITVGK